MDEYKESADLQKQYKNVATYIGSLFKKMGEEIQEEKENTT